MSKNYYLTTTLPYVNAEPHIGFALEIVQADVLARYHRLLGENVIFNFGTDEHGQKILEKAQEEKKDPQKYADEYAAKFDQLKTTLNLSYDHFIRTTAPHHLKAAQAFWRLCDQNGFIYKKNYQAKYCVGCELEKTDSELENNRCPLHPNKELELIKEENYFFKFSAFQKPLLKLYQKNPNFIVPNFRSNEIKSFVKAGLQDFSISRLKEKMPWGIPVPGDPDHVMYVWFDALINYISTLGWPNKDISAWWPGIQIAGKDNLRQQTAIWQAMLLSTGIPNSQQIFIHGFISLKGQKISKSTGNTISPFDLEPKYTTDAIRYYLLAKVHPFNDSDFTLRKFERAYTDDLANGLGNLISRVAKMSENLEFDRDQTNKPSPQINKHLNNYRFDQALNFIWQKIKKADALINQTEVWKLKGKEKQKILTTLVNQIRSIAFDLEPFLPETSEKILEQFKGPVIKSAKPLFPRLK
jgi:methionyl-tRNA synthetase